MRRWYAIHSIHSNAAAMISSKAESAIGNCSTLLPSAHMSDAVQETLSADTSTENQASPASPPTSRYPDPDIRTAGPGLARRLHQEVDGTHKALKGVEGLGQMEFCGKTGLQAKVTGKVEGDAFIASSYELLKPDSP